jgi:amidase
VLRRRWGDLFARFDVVLAPPLGVPAFPHIGAGAMQTATLTINGRQEKYSNQLAWAGVATFPGLPATVAPVGQSKGGLPISVQIIGPFLEDLTTIAVAGLLAEAMG